MTTQALVNTFNHQSGDYLERDGAKIYFEVAGSDANPPLLVLHGGFGTLEDFNGILPHLHKAFKVIGVDSRGQGKSTLGPKTLTYEAIQNDVLGVLDHLKIDTLSIIGFSDGGITAYRLAALGSLKIEKLVTIGSRWHVKNTESTKDLLLKVSGASWRKKFPATYDAYQKLNPVPDFDVLAQSLVRLWLDPESSGYPNFAVQDIACPLLIVRGDDDHLLPLEAVVELKRLVDHSRLLNIPFAGHAAFEDQKALFLIVLNEFLSD